MKEEEREGREGEGVNEGRRKGEEGGGTKGTICWKLNSHECLR